MELELTVCKTFLKIPAMAMIACARVGARAKEREDGEGRGDDENPLPCPPTLSFFFPPVPTFSRNSLGKDCYAGYSDFTTFLVNENVEDECTKQFRKTVFEYKWSCY